jgi:lipoate-protein ligase A
MSNVLRVIVDGAADGAANMALDESLLLLAGEPTLRLYGWNPHTVSLGYFQRFAEFADVVATVPLVRRLTGGGAIHHGDELTFALAIDADRLPADIGASYRLLHGAAIAALSDLGVASHLVDGGDAPHARPRERWCFREPGRDDVATHAGKLLGSAQRRVHAPRPRVLHHGSLVLARPSLTPFVAAVADTAPIDDALRQRLADALVAHVASALGLAPRPGKITPAQREHADRLARERYGDPAFTRLR